MNPTDTPAINGWNDLMQLHSQNSLECLPDGSVISWERLLGDDTSRAIAFTRTEYGEDGQPVFWISPGGWQPMAPGDAGVTYPVTVLWIGSPADHLAPMPSATRPSEYELRRDAMLIAATITARHSSAMDNDRGLAMLLAERADAIRGILVAGL